LRRNRGAGATRHSFRLLSLPVRTSRRKRAGRAEESGPHLKGCGEFDGPRGYNALLTFSISLPVY
jgi:hypothetical protein